MTLLAPVVEWRLATAPNATISSVALTGSGYNGAIPVGTASTVVTVRLYNNFANAASIGDATNCVLAVYDDTIHQGTAVTVPSTSQYISVSCTDYNGNPAGGDVQFYAIGGSIKHPIPVNGGTIAGAAPNYVTVQIQATIPQNATQGSVSQGLWVEYSSTA